MPDDKKAKIGMMLGLAPPAPPDERRSVLLHSMRELHECLKANDYEGAADAFEAAFRHCDMEPHNEGPHEG